MVRPISNDIASIHDTHEHIRAYEMLDEIGTHKYAGHTYRLLEFDECILFGPSKPKQPAMLRLEVLRRTPFVLPLYNILVHLPFFVDQMFALAFYLDVP